MVRHIMTTKQKIPLLTLSLNVYNEEDNIETIYKECNDVLERAEISHEIFFVDAGSIDNSWKILQNLERKHKDCRIFQSERRPGKQVNTGMKHAMGKYFGYMCSDGQDNPEVIPTYIKLLEENKADFVKARRLDRIFWQRKVISRVYNKVADFLFGLNLRDINMHPKIFRRELVEGVNLISEGESLDLEIILRAHMKGYKIVEMPIEERKRAGGKSSVNSDVARRMIEDMVSYKWGSKKTVLMESIYRQDIAGH